MPTLAISGYFKKFVGHGIKRKITLEQTFEIHALFFLMNKNMCNCQKESENEANNKEMEFTGENKSTSGMWLLK